MLSFDFARAISGSGFGIIDCRYVEADELRSQGSGDRQDCRHVRRASDGVRLLHEGWPLPYLRGGTRPHKEREDSGPTDAERIELFKSMFAWGGIYKIEGNKIIFDVDIAWVQSWVGTTRTYQVEMASNKLTVTTPPFKSTLDGQDIVVVTTYERAE